MVKPLGAEEKAKEPETTGKGRTEDEKKEIFPLETRVENTSKARKVTGFVEFPTFAQEKVPLTEHDTIPQGQKTAWPWENALKSWMGSNPVHRLVLRETMSARFSPGPQPLYTQAEWKVHIKSFSAPYHPKAEVMVQLLAVILQTGPGNPKKGHHTDLSEMCASIRCQKTEDACLEMAMIFDDYLDDLDFEPTSKEIARLYNVIESVDDEWPAESKHIAPISQRKMYGLLARLDWTLGSEDKLRHGRDFSTFSLTERCRRLSVNLQEAEQNTGLFGTAAHHPSAEAAKMEPLAEESGFGDNESGSVPADENAAFITGSDAGSRVASAVSSRPGSMTKTKLEKSKDLRSEKQGKKKKNVLFDIDKYDSICVKVAKLTLLEDEFKEMVLSDQSLLKLWNDVDSNRNGLVGLGEWNAFVKRRYPIIDYTKPMNAAFIGATQDEGGELFKDGGSKAVALSERVLRKRDFKRFLELTIQFTRLWYAYMEIDLEMDDRVDLKSYKSGRRAFRGVLKLDNDVTVEEEVLAEFKLMDVGHAGGDPKDMGDDGDDGDDGDESDESDDLISWTTVSEWWLAQVEEDDIPWIPDPQLSSVLNYGRTFDFDSLQDLVVHCHYVTRVATGDT